jgi:hypothetical protein
VSPYGGPSPAVWAIGPYNFVGAGAPAPGGGSNITFSRLLNPSILRDITRPLTRDLKA